MSPQDRLMLRIEMAKMLNKSYSQPMTPTERIKGGASAIPVVGDAISGYDAYQAFKQGNYGEAALNAIGLLPMIPTLGMVTKTHTDDILDAIKSNGNGSYGIRVIPHGDPTPNIGDVLNPSRKWVDGDMLDKQLRGTSTMGLKSKSENSILDAFNKLGIHQFPGKRENIINYDGQDVVVVKGLNKGTGNDPGERLIGNATVIWRGKKKSRNMSDLE